MKDNWVSEGVDPMSPTCLRVWIRMADLPGERLAIRPACIEPTSRAGVLRVSR